MSPSCPGWVKHWSWFGPSGATNGDVETLSDLRKGEAWELRAWAEGPASEELPPLSAYFEVGNSLPGGGVVTIEPATPLPDSELVATIVTAPTDIDDDALTLEYRWSADGAVTTHTTAVIPHEDTAAGQVWEVVVTAVETANDTARGPAFTASASIDALPPTAPVVQISPANPMPSEELHAIIVQDATDPYALPLDYIYSWRRDQVAVASTLATIDGASVGPHEVWDVEVVADNGLKQSPPASASVVVQNQLPIVQGVALTPVPFNVGTGVAAVVTGADDPDGDPVTLSYRWSVNGEWQPLQVGASLPGSAFKRGDNVAVEVEVADGYGGTLTAQSAELQAANAPPGPPSDAGFSPTFPRGSDSASVSAVLPADLDGDPVELVVEWFADGVSTETSSDVVRTNEQLSNAVWTARVATTDGIDISSFEDVPGSLRLCAVLTPEDFSRWRLSSRPTYSIWDPKACVLNVFESWASGFGIDPGTGQIVDRSLKQVPRGPNETIDLEENLFGKAWIGPYDDHHHMSLVTVPYMGSSTSGSEITMAAPSDFDHGSFVGAGVTRNQEGRGVLYALHDYYTTSQQHKRRLLKHVFSMTGETTEISVGNLPDLSLAKQSFYHAPTSEIIIGPNVPSVLEMWAVNVETGATRKIQTDSFAVGWQYDATSQKYHAYVPFRGYGLGELDPTTGDASWHEPVNGFRFPKYENSQPTWGVFSQNPAYVPDTGDTFAIYEDQALVRYDAAMDAIRDITPPIPFDDWTYDEMHEKVDVVARSATGTVIVLGLGTESMTAMARVFEVDVTQGTVTWLTPLEGSQAPRWVRVPAIAYDAVADALLVHGGVIDSGTGASETWRFDLVARQWHRVAGNGPPRVGGTLMFDEAHDRLLYYGGRQAPLNFDPPWRNDVWQMNLQSGTWSLLHSGGGANAPLNLWHARAAIDVSGEQLFVYGGWYPCVGCVSQEAIHQFDLLTGTWSARRELPSSGTIPAATFLWTMLGGASNEVSAVRENRQDREFLFVGRMCSNSQFSSYGLMMVGWDDPNPAWSYAIEAPSVNHFIGHLAYDPIRKVAHSIWPEVAENQTGCHDLYPTGSKDDVTFSWP